MSRDGQQTMRTAVCRGTHFVTEVLLAAPCKEAKAGRVWRVRHEGQKSVRLEKWGQPRTRGHS